MFKIMIKRDFFALILGVESDNIVKADSAKCDLQVGLAESCGQIRKTIS